MHTYRDITETEESGSSQGLMARVEETICIKMENKQFSLDVSSDWNILRPLPKQITLWLYRSLVMIILILKNNLYPSPN